ncbi:CHAT domain-containing protein [Microcoleus sp. A003_D6]|uniref:CHAT domain-containing tetratricopeptide repeat protein n=1 Tax=Microcoleus sp. A003_D6 TaxID=3055266 RepID=UPI002FD70805
MEILQANCLLINNGLIRVMQEGQISVSYNDNKNKDWLISFSIELINNLETWNELNEKSIEFLNLGNYKNGIIFAHTALELTKRIGGDKSPYAATSLHNLSVLYQAEGSVSKAEQKCVQSLEIRKLLFDKQDRDVAISLNTLATIYSSQGLFNKASKLLMETLEIRKNIYRKENTHVANSLNNLAFVWKIQGRYAEAEQYYIEALSIRKTLFGTQHRDVASSLNNLASLYLAQGHYAEAEQYYIEALSIRKTLLGNEHRDLANSLNNLASLYLAQGRYTEAEQYYIESLSIRKTLLGNEHSDVASSLNNLASLYLAQEHYAEAERYYLESLSIEKRLFDSEHHNIATTLNNLAELYRRQIYYDLTEEKYLQALNMRISLFGTKHIDVALVLNNIAKLYYDQGSFTKAIETFNASIQILKNTLVETHYDVASVWNNLAISLVAIDCNEEALLNLSHSNMIEDKIISNIFGFSSERDRLIFLKKIRGDFEGFLSLVHSHLANSPESVKSALNLIFKRKGLTASALAAQNEALYSDQYPHLTEHFQKLRDLSEQITHFTFSIPQTEDFITYQQQLAQLQAEHNSLQKTLASQVPEIKLQEQLPNCSDVASELPAGSVLIEFIRFDIFNFKAIPAKGEGQWQPARYLAFILPAGQPESVEMIDIGEAEYIDSLIREFRELRTRTGSKGGMWSPTRKLSFKQYDPQAGIKLRQAIFDKLRPALKEHQHLIIAPDGELNLVPFQILPSDDTGEKMLMDEFIVSYLTVGRDILRQKIETKRSASLNALVFASPNFDLSAESVTFDAAPEKNTQTANLRECIANKPLKSAVGTNILGERIAQRLKVASYLGNEALESYFKPLKCPRILLVATHGVFLPNQPEESSPNFPDQMESSLLQRDRFFGRVENPMLRSALALAGANTWAKGGKLPPEAGKGILFAQDVAGLDLWANEITVLSACETGLGDVAIGEGVFGLRRAFTVAGAKTLIMSLWSVNGWATTLLMERFFDNCEAGLGRATALQEAQNYLRNITVGELQQFELGREILKDEFNNGRELDDAILARQAEDKLLAHPYYWGAWICQGDTTSLPFTACS